MSDDHSDRINNADGVTGIQASGDVYNSTVYIVDSDDPPQKQYEVGVRHLRDGIPAQARKLITKAIAHGHDSGQVRFHLVLALLSKRAYRDLPPEDREQLARTEAHLHILPEDEYKRALRVIYELLACLQGSGEPSTALRRLRELPDAPRQQIIHHLDHVLTGNVKDDLWHETRRTAETRRESGDRRGRIWAYFQRDPIPPRVGEPAPDRTSFRDRMLATFWSAVAAASIGYLAWLAFTQEAALPLLALPIALAAGYAGVTTGLDWYYHWQRLRAKDREYLGQRGVNRAPEGGFANDVDRSFSTYFGKYVPRGTSREDWLAATAGIRKSLRDEIVELYRESRVAVGRVKWLISYLVSEVRKHSENGTLWQYRERHRVPPRTKLWCSVATVSLATAALLLVATAVQAATFPSVIATATLVLAGAKGAMYWFGIIAERRRLREEIPEYEQRRRERQEAYERWKHKLDANRPSEHEMEKWLNCDVTLLLDEALNHYRLAWRDVVAHGVLLTPSRGCQRARATGGLWRYSRYDVRLFLITQDGVRELVAQLDFREVNFEIRARNNYRFDAVSSVYVGKTDDYSYELRLTLTNGPSHEIEVTGLDVPQAESEADPEMFAAINLAAAGFDHTLHILEGIAAEGRGWIHRDQPGNPDPTPRELDALPKSTRTDQESRSAPR